jgi:hypothetical protein
MSGFVDDHKNGSFSIELKTSLHLSDAVIANEFNLSAGQSMGKHVHDYSHISILSRGIVQLEKFNDGDSDAFEILTIDATDKAVTLIVDANIYHRITAIEDADWFCIHAEQG